MIVTPIIWIPLRPAARDCRSQEPFAAATSDASAKRKLRPFLHVPRSKASPCNDLLDRSEFRRCDHPAMTAWQFFARPWVGQYAGIVRVPKKVINRLRGEQTATAGLDTPMPHQAPDFGFSVFSRGEL